MEMENMDMQNHNHEQMSGHDHGHEHEQPTAKDWVLFALIIVFIFLVAFALEYLQHSFSGPRFMREFMGAFFLVFACFKLLDLKGFVMSYIGYDLIARNFTAYAYAYPFIELALAAGFFSNFYYTNILTVIIMVIGAIGVSRELLRGSKIKCACLGTYIKLPLTTVSLIEDLVMAIMALVLLLGRV